MSEANHQAALFRWARMQEVMQPELKLLHAIPNGAYFGGSKWTGWRMKQEGLKPGVPDVCLPVPRGAYHGLYIELKNDKPKGYATQEQKIWLASLTEQGYATLVAYGWQEARMAIEGYLTGPQP